MGRYVFLLVACLLATNTAAYIIEHKTDSDDSHVDSSDGEKTDLYKVNDVNGGMDKAEDLLGDGAEVSAPGVPEEGDLVDGKQDGREQGRGEGGDALTAFRLSPHVAKSVLRVRRGWVKEITGEAEEEHEARKRAERNREAQALAAHLNRVCPGECWGPYGGFTACSAPCGNSGVKWQSRPVQPSGQCGNWVASNGCPGEARRSDSCHRFCNNGGTPLAASCTCPPGYRGTCCETRITCGNPGGVAHGTFTPGGTLHVYGVTVTYACELGYRLVGTPTRVCQNSGQWNNAVPTCEIIDCGDPGTPAHARRTGVSFTFGESLAYTCEDGYQLSGDSVRQCEESGQWSGTAPTCTLISCGQLVAPDNGAVATPGGITYGQTATYTCNEHYYLHGSDTRSCELDGSWSGSAPDCAAILCSRVEAPESGSVTFTGSLDDAVMHGGTASYDCAEGYTLVGSVTRTCSGEGPGGVWTGDQPACEPVNCGDPGPVENGVRADTGFYFPTGRATYECNAGYFMAGSSELRCLASATWSGSKPTCTACPLNEYKSGTNIETECDSCPDNSHTAAPASHSLEQCECDLGYEGDNGGPCTLITCDPLEAPDNGYMDSCARTYNEVCHSDCNEGYIQVGGDDDRTCQLNKQWSGAPLVCAACAEDTYKADATTCTYCPEDSHTLGEASSLSGCICDEGFQGPNGGPCQDVNECEVDNGGCEQTCENEIGDYRCSCTLPGYIQDSQNAAGCVPKNQCPDLEPLENGGFVCVAEVATSTQRCQPKCNYGYEHFVRPNSYEECGPSTNWIWSSDLRDVPLFPCQKAFFAGITLEVDMFYFTDDCESLTSGQLASVKEEFLQFLTTEKGVCNSATLPCEVTDCTVECGDTDGDDGVNDLFGRRRRQADANTALKVKFNIRVDAVTQDAVDCDAVCDRQGASERYCTNTCRDNYLANVTGVLSGDVSDALGPGPGDSGAIHVGEVSLVPRAAPVVVQLPPSCDEGMVQVGESCAPCMPGSYKSDNSSECLVCPPQTYQPDRGQTDCLPCRWMYDWGVPYCKDPLEIIIEITREAFNIHSAEEVGEEEGEEEEEGE